MAYRTNIKISKKAISIILIADGLIAPGENISNQISLPPESYQTIQTNILIFSIYYHFST